MSSNTATAFATADETLTPAHLDRARLFLEQTQSGIEGAMKCVSEAQWNFKPAADRWSIAENVEHIVAVQERVRPRSAGAGRGARSGTRLRQGSCRFDCDPSVPDAAREIRRSGSRSSQGWDATAGSVAPVGRELCAIQRIPAIDSGYAAPCCGIAAPRGG